MSARAWVALRRKYPFWSALNDLISIAVGVLIGWWIFG